MRARRLAAAGAFGVLVALAAPESALAHGLVGRTNLPIPVWLFGWGAAVVLLISFAALSLLWREPKLEDAHDFRPLPAWISKPLVNRVTEVLAGAIGVGLLVLVVVSGLFGVQAPANSNFSLIFIYVTFWVGLVFVSILFGDVFKAFNPWRAIARATGFVASRVAGPLPAPFPYPARLGHWPAVATILGFAWIELAYTSGEDPSTLAIATLVYSAVTLLGIALYGTESWIAYGEGFSVYFNLFSRISPVTVKDRWLGLRLPLSGLAHLNPVNGTVALLVVMLGTVTFDGASAGPMWRDVGGWFRDRFVDLGFVTGTASELSFTIGILLGLAVIALIYVVGTAGARTVDQASQRTVMRRFVHTLVPIAAVYAIAHYFSFLVYEGQAMGYLISDPLGEGSDFFGTADKGIDYGVIGATAIWYIQVSALVIGHVGGLVLAHDRALAAYKNVKDAVRSQYWMLGVMIFYTTLGLWLLWQANR